MRGGWFPANEVLRVCAAGDFQEIGPSPICAAVDFQPMRCCANAQLFQESVRNLPGGPGPALPGDVKLLKSSDLSENCQSHRKKLDLRLDNAIIALDTMPVGWQRAPAIELESQERAGAGAQGLGGEIRVLGRVAGLTGSFCPPHGGTSSADRRATKRKEVGTNRKEAKVPPEAGKCKESEGCRRVGGIRGDTG